MPTGEWSHWPRSGVFYFWLWTSVPYCYLLTYCYKIFMVNFKENFLSKDYGSAINLQYFLSLRFNSIKNNHIFFTLSHFHNLLRVYMLQLHLYSYHHVLSLLHTAWVILETLYILIVLQLCSYSRNKETFSIIILLKSNFHQKLKIFPVVKWYLFEVLGNILLV